MCKHLAIMGLCALLLGTLHAPVARAAEAPLTVFAAASTTNTLTDIATLYAAEGQGKVQMSFASSSTLAKQIENGAPADIFLSANAQWMDYLASKDLLVPGSRADLLGNSIVLIAPASYTGPKVDINASLKLAALLGAEGRLSVGDPSHVPVPDCHCHFSGGYHGGQFSGKTLYAPHGGLSHAYQGRASARGLPYCGGHHQHEPRHYGLCGAIGGGQKLVD